MVNFDNLFNLIITNSDFISKIHKIEEIEPINIKFLILNILKIYNTEEYINLNLNELEILIEKVYNYIINEYFTIDSVNKENYKDIFDMYLKSALDKTFFEKRLYIRC